MKRIAFQTYMGEAWLAGSTATLGLLQAVRSLGNDAPEVDLVVSKGTAPASYRAALPYISEVVTVEYSAPAKASSPPTVRKGLFHRTFHRPPVHPSYSQVLLQRGVACLFSTISPHRMDFGLPSVVWLPDFQHRRLPEMFSPGERSKRDRFYLSEIEAATLVTVTAEDVRLDLAAFAPQHAEKGRLLPLLPALAPEVYSLDPASTLATYHVPQKFFLLPNQFWKHKNHALVLEALSLLRKRGLFPTVVCTGRPYDDRHPEYVAELLAQISRFNLRDQFIMLGIVPRQDVILLMRQSVCVINASLFEGFGFSLAESRVLGKRALVSDLPAHREQNSPDAVYFDPNRAVDLADKLESIWNSTPPGPDLAREAAARAALPGQFTGLGRTFLAILTDAVARWKSAHP